MQTGFRGVVLHGDFRHFRESTTSRSRRSLRTEASEYGKAGLHVFSHDGADCFSAWVFSRRYMRSVWQTISFDSYVFYRRIDAELLVWYAC